MTTVTLKLPVRPHPNQRAIIDSTTRYNVIAAGRRFGKTEASKIRAIYRALQYRIWWVTPTHSSGTDTWRDFLATFSAIPGCDINKSERRIATPTGGELKMIAADSFKRGAGIQHVFIDEAAFVSPNLWGYEIRPMLLESKGGADFLSSTNGRNWFWQIFQQGLDPMQPDWASWHFTSYDNPMIDPAELEDIKGHTPARVFEQEYLAAWLDDGGAVFRNLAACTYTGNIERQGDTYIGIDWARHHDYTVFVVIDKSGTVLEIDRFNEIDWTMQRNRLTALAQRYNPAVIWAETNSIGEPNIEELRKGGLPVRGFTTTAKSKAEIINALALAFEQSDIRIPDNPVLLSELQAYTLERLPSGNFRYTAPAGLHDDTVIALALAWHGISQHIGYFFPEF